ncbi:MAG: cell wall hydrolase [bacterium]|nr:cell wall hydrolase [bacterium]
MKVTMKKVLICLMAFTVALSSLGVNASAASKKTSYSSADLKYLTAIIYCEAGNQSYKGKVAVADVIINRKKSKKFPNTFKGVIYQKGQFTPARSGSLAKALKKYEGKMKYGYGEKKQMEECKKAAKAALNGKFVVSKSTYFFTMYRSKSAIKKKYPKAVFIGDHYFR